jgi:hypothetical protein
LGSPGNWKAASMNLNRTQTSGFQKFGEPVDLRKTKKSKSTQEFLTKFADFAARTLDIEPHKRDWQTGILHLYDEAVMLLEQEQEQEQALRQIP